MPEFPTKDSIHTVLWTIGYIGLKSNLLLLLLLLLFAVVQGIRNLQFSITNPNK